MGEEKFSRYELKEELGQGGMATVYRAYDPLFEREVALKILKQERLNDVQVRERFERETKIIAKLEHAAIVPVYDVGRSDNDQLFFVMRYMAGGSLADRIQNGSLSLLDAANILQRLGGALDYAHAKGIIHRDLKPGNILFDEYENAYISDFGIAKLAQASTKITNSGIIGTPTHMSPEQAQGEEVDGRSDIYSLGVILFEMLSGHTPFEATTPLGMALKHAIEPPPRILDVNPNLPAGVDAVIKKVLEKERDRRYRSGTEFANAFLGTLAQPLTSDANLVTLPPSQVQQDEEVIVLPRPDVAPKHQPLHQRWMFGGFIALALTAFVVWRSPLFAASVTATPPPATVTLAPSTPTVLPPVTDTQTPTKTMTPTISVDPGIGGANKIALTANDDIYVMDLDGSHIRQLTNTNKPKFDLQWLPDGNELLYGEANCIYKINFEAAPETADEVACFKDPKFEGFRVSPDGKQIAISIERRLLVLPFDLKTLSTISSAFELQSLEDLCLDYADVAVKRVRWSADGQSLAVLYQSVVRQRLGDTIRVLAMDMERCQKVDPLIMDEFPGKRFTPDGYERYPILPSYDWDGNQRFLFNSFKRNVGYGELYLYDISKSAVSRIDPIGGVCCYGSTAFSPDGTYILLAFQDVRRGAESETQLYYVPADQIEMGTKFTPIKLPIQFFPDLREDIQLALRPAIP
jgi:serine/threonine protein kinase